MKKRLCSVLLCLCMALSLLPATALAAETPTNVAKIGNIEYATLAEAASAAQSGQTVQVLRDAAITTSTLFSLKAGVTFEGTVDAAGKPAAVCTVTLSGNNGVLSIGSGTVLRNLKFKVNSIGNSGNVFAAYGAFTMENCEVELASSVSTWGYVFDMTTNVSTASITNCTFIDSTAGDFPTWVVGFPYADRYTSTESFSFSGNTVTGRWSCGVIDLLAGSYEVKNNTVAVTGSPDTIFGIAVAPNVSASAYASAITGNSASGGEVFLRYVPIDADNTVSAAPTAVTIRENSKPTVSGNTFSGNMTPCDVCIARTHNCFASLTMSGNPFASGSDIASYTESRQIAAGFVSAWAAQIGTTSYPTLTAAVEAAVDGGTITLLANVTENITIPSDKTITLDLNGNTLTGVTEADETPHSNNKPCKAVITNSGTLTILDTASGGVITDVSPYFKKATIYNTSTGTLNLLGGTVSKGTAGAYYVLLNHGTATIDGATVQSADTETSAILNGYSTSAWETIPTDSNTKIATMTISSGTVTGGRYAVKNGEAYAKLEITGGTFSKGAADAAAIVNYSNCEAVISGGTFAADGAEHVILCKARSNTSGAGTLGLSVTGGSFSGSISAGQNQKLTISGGCFTTDPSAYVANGKISQATAKTGYNFEVMTKTNPIVEVSSAPAEVKIPEGSAAEMVAAGNALQDTPTVTTGLEGAAGQEAQNVTTTAEQGAAALSAAGVTGADNSNTKIYEQPYLSIGVTGVNTGAAPSLTVNIVPMVKTVVSTAETAENIATDGNGKNAVQIGEAKRLTVTTPVTIKLPITAVMAGTPVGGAYPNLQIKHVKENGSIYYYTAKVTVEAPAAYYATFTVTHGFSEFTLMAADNRSLVVTYDSAGGSAVTTPVTYSITEVGAALPTSAKSGYTFLGWVFTGFSGTHTTLPDLWSNGGDAGGVTAAATAQFSAASSDGVSTCILSFDANGGSKLASVSMAYGTTIDLSAYVPAREGYSFAGWCSDKALTAAVASVKLTANTTIYARWTVNGTFTDVAADAYYKDAVNWAVERGVTEGTDATTFSPNAACTRAQAIAFLWRACGQPEPAGTLCPFTDVSTDAYYYKAVLWAAEKGIAQGTSAAAFSPDAVCSRAQIVTFQYRAAGSPAAGTVNPFTDVASDAYYASAVLWAVKEGITEGTTAAAFSPNADCTRAQIVTFLFRQLGK